MSFLVKIENGPIVACPKLQQSISLQTQPFSYFYPLLSLGIDALFMSGQDQDDAILHRLALKQSLTSKSPPRFSFMKATSSSLQKNLSLASLPTKTRPDPNKPTLPRSVSRRSIVGLLSARTFSSDPQSPLASPSRQTETTYSTTSPCHATPSSHDIRTGLRKSSKARLITMLSPSTHLSSFIAPSPQSKASRIATLPERIHHVPVSISNLHDRNTSPRGSSKRADVVTGRFMPGSQTFPQHSPSRSFSAPSQEHLESPTRRIHTNPEFRQPADRQKPPGNVFERLYPNKKNPAPSLSIPRQTSHKQIPRLTQRISLIKDLVAILRKKDPDLTSSANTHHDLYENPQVSSSLLCRQNFNEYELRELARKPPVYFFPDSDSRSLALGTADSNFGYDDKDGNYLGDAHDHIAYRYEILRVLGKGTFGIVFFARDHKYRQSLVAIKIIKNNPAYSLQAMTELKLLKLLTQLPHPHTLRLFAHFVFRGHVCIVTEALDLNLYRMMELTEFSGMSPQVVRPFIWQILAGLDYIHGHGIIHCDIKPENIMLSQLSSNQIGVKIIDIGLACYHGQGPNTYIQSRFYRAPEVICGAPYDAKIDVWLVACVASELITGTPLLPGRNEAHQFALMLELLGAPDQATVLRIKRSMVLGNNTHESDSDAKAPRSKRALKSCLLFKLFDGHGKLLTGTLSQLANGDRAGKYQIRLGPKLLAAALHLDDTECGGGTQVLALLHRMLVWDPRARCSVQELMKDPYFSEETYEMQV